MTEDDDVLTVFIYPMPKILIFGLGDSIDWFSILADAKIPALIDIIKKKPYYNPEIKIFVMAQRSHDQGIGFIL